MTTATAHRLTLSAAEYAYLVGALDLSMPPGWEPDPTEAAAGDLLKKGVLRGDGDLTVVHPSVTMNLRILAGPRIMLDTTATIGTAGLHSVYAVLGALGGSLFALEDGAVELSMFAATELGQELIRAVPEESDTAIGSALGNGSGTGRPSGLVPLAALHELGIAELLRGADPRAPEHVLAELNLPDAQAALAAQVASRTNGALVCVVTAVVAESVRTARVAWLHTDAGWVGIRPDTGGLVRLDPVARADLGVWVAPSVAEALDG